MTDYTDLKARLRAWPQHELLAAALAAIEEQEQRPCPHVRSSGTTQWCELAQSAPAPEPVAWRWRERGGSMWRFVKTDPATWDRQRYESEPLYAAPQPAPAPAAEPDNASVICPKCCHQFRAISVIDQLYRIKLEQELTAAIAASQPAQAEPCCGEYATCLRPCTPRGRWLAGQEHEEIADSASVCGWVAEADSRKVGPATSVKDTDCLNLFVAPVLAAACRMDWQQVILNGGPPCFHVEANGCFCLRAERWAGHQSDHDYVSLASLLVSMDPQPAQADEAREIINIAMAVIGYLHPQGCDEYVMRQEARIRAYLARTGGEEETK